MKSFNCLAALNLLLPLFVFANPSKKDSQNGYELPKPEVRKAMVLELAKQVWVPRKWNQTDDEWAASVFDRATGQ